MPAPNLRTVLLLAPLVLAACSGRTDVIGGGDGGSGGSSGGSSSGSSSGSSGGSSSGSSSGATGSCVDIALSSFDTSCQTASDCISIVSGQVCSGQCDCGGSTINASGEARYKSELSSIQLGLCGCPLEPTPQCLQNQCTICRGLPSDPPACGTTSADAGQGEAGVCVNIDLSTYDQSCQASSDCISVTAGTICSGGCACGGSTINVSGQARYQNALSGVTIEACPCSSDGIPTCVQNTCTLCVWGQNQPGCGDGG